MAFVSVCGKPGSGKSYILEEVNKYLERGNLEATYPRISSLLPHKVVFEKVDVIDIPAYYKKMDTEENTCFLTQISFFANKVRRFPSISKHLQSSKLVLEDRSLEENKIFFNLQSQLNKFTTQEKEAYQSLWSQTLKLPHATPDIWIYLDTDLKSDIKRMELRGDKVIDKVYFQRLEKSYIQWKNEKSNAVGNRFYVINARKLINVHDILNVIETHIARKKN